MDDNGLACKIKSSTAYKSPRTFPAGSKVTVCCNPETGYVTDQKAEKTLVWVGFVTFVMGVLVLYSCIEKLIG